MYWLIWIYLFFFLLSLINLVLFYFFSPICYIRMTSKFCKIVLYERCVMIWPCWSSPAARVNETCFFFFFSINETSFPNYKWFSILALFALVLRPAITHMKFKIQICRLSSNGMGPIFPRWMTEFMTLLSRFISTTCILSYQQWTQHILAEFLLCVEERELAMNLAVSVLKDLESAKDRKTEKL